MFSYGVLETLRGIEVVTKTGRKTRLLDGGDLMARHDHFERQLAAASRFSETDRGFFSGWRRHTRNLSLGGRNHQFDTRGPGFEEAQRPKESPRVVYPDVSGALLPRAS